MWAMELAEYDIEYKPRTSIKAQALADFLAEGISIEEDHPLTHGWILYVDGSSSKEGSGAGLLIINPNEEELEYALRFDFEATNNEAEYEVLIAGLSLARKLGAQQIIARSDSQLIVFQINGDYEAKEDNMRRYLSKVQHLKRTFEHFSVEHIPRSANKRADVLSRLASSTSATIGKKIVVELVKHRAFDANEVLQHDYRYTWMDEIVNYLQHQTQLKDKFVARRLCLKASRYALFNDHLYRKSFSQPWLRCVTEEEGDYILRELHMRICGSHSGARSVARKCYLAGYYWPTIRKDAEELVKKCQSC